MPMQWLVKLRGTGASTGLWKWPVCLQHLGEAETFWTMTSGSSKSLVLVLCAWKALSRSTQLAAKRRRKGRDRCERKRLEGANVSGKYRPGLESVVAKPASQNMPGGSRDHARPSKHPYLSLARHFSLERQIK